MVFRQHIVEVRGVPTATTSLSSLAVAPPPWVPPPALTTPPPDRVTSVGNRLRPHHGGTHERRVRRASARHYPPPRRPPRQADLLGPGPHRGVVPQVVGALPRVRRRWPVRPDPGPPRHPADPARIGAGYPLHPPAAPGPRLAGHPLQPDRRRRHPGRAEGPGHPPAAQPAHRRARAPAPRPHHAPRTPPPAVAAPGLPRPAGTTLQPTP